MSFIKKTILNAKGLYTFPNPLCSVPQGALAVAVDVTINQVDTVTKRLGFIAYGTTVSPFQNMYSFKNTLLGWDKTHLFYDSDGAGTWEQLSGTYSAPIGRVRIPSVQSNNSLFLATGNGVLVMDTPTSTPILAGVPYPLDAITTLNATTAGWFSSQNTVAYQAFIGYVDANNQTQLSAPSETTVVTNNINVTPTTITTVTDSTHLVIGSSAGMIAGNTITDSTAGKVTTITTVTDGTHIIVASTTGMSGGDNIAQSGTATVTLQWTIPTGLSTNYFYRIYRTRQTAFVGGLAQDPGSEVYEVVQKPLTSTDITNQYVTYTDLTPDNLLGAAASTNPTQNTIASANYRPPYVSGGMAFYQNVVLYANIKTQQLAEITFIAVGSGGFTTGNTITIGTSTFTGGSSNNYSTKTFKIDTSGTPAENIYNTARNLVNVINLSGQTQYWAINLSGFSSTPGQIQLVEQLIGASAFAITSNNGTYFNPPIPSSGVTYVSESTSLPNYLAVSNIQQPAAVPLGNLIPVGTPDKPIIGIAALRTSVFIFKAGGGIYRLQGTTLQNFVVTLFDSSVNCIAQDTIATLANQVWFWSNQGIVAVNDNGPIIESRQIEQDLRNISSSLYPNFATATYAVGYETDRQYQIYTVSNTTDTIATQSYIYNYMADVTAWFNWNLTNTAAIINPVDDTLYLSNFQNGNYVAKQRRTQTIFDYADFQYDFNIVSSSGYTVIVDDSTNITAGGTIYQTDSVGNFIGQSIVVAVINSTTITVTDLIGWQPGLATFYTNINSYFEYTDVGDNFDIVKHWKDVELFFRDTSFTNLTFSVYSSEDPVAESITLTGNPGLGWGQVPFGVEEWGGTPGITNIMRTFIPQNKARAGWLNPSVQNNEALSNFALTGINIYFDYTSSRRR